MIMEFATVFAMEVILAIDNIVFISILCSSFEKSMHTTLRFIGLSFAIILRILSIIVLINYIQSTKVLISLFSFDITYKNILFISGGLFLGYKGVKENYRFISSKKNSKSKPVALHFLLPFCK